VISCNFVDRVFGGQKIIHELHEIARTILKGFRIPNSYPPRSVLISSTNVADQSQTAKDPLELLRRSLEEHIQAIQSLLNSKLEEIEQTGRVICRTLAAGNKILLCGNGGSAADAQHIAAELVGRYEQQRKAFPAIALTTDTSALTALSNDYGYDEVFARQVMGLARTGDLLIAISTSGKSPNIVKAVETAKSLGCQTLALTGCSGQPLASLCDFALVVASDRTARVQEAHITIGHLWCEMVDRAAGTGFSDALAV
jgi:D-sedoheptulose 7-phosphate isomerase